MGTIKSLPTGKDTHGICDKCEKDLFTKLDKKEMVARKSINKIDEACRTNLKRLANRSI